MNTQHELKIWPEYFDDVESGEKTFEVRKNDRDFKVGDILLLREYCEGGYPEKTGCYSGRETKKIITYIMQGGQWGIPEGICIIGLQSAPTIDAGKVFEEKDSVNSEIEKYLYMKEQTGYGHTIDDMRKFVKAGAIIYKHFGKFTQYCNQQPVSGSNILSSKVCPDCGGTGIIVDYVAVCCRNPNKDGSCCNSPIPEPIQIQCCRCEATGYLKTTPAPVVNHEEVARKILDDLDDYLIDHPEGSRYKFGLPTESKFYLNQMLEIVKNNLKQITGNPTE